MSASLIQGIGDEVLLYCGALFTVLAGILVLSSYYKQLFDFSYPVDEAFMPTSQGGTAYNVENCPICLGPHILAVETNCGHKFCGHCIDTYINNRERPESLFASVTCPMCRQSINLLMMSFARDSTTDQEGRREIESFVYEFNVRYGNGPRSWMTYIRDCPILIRHLFANFFCYEGIVWFFRLRVLCCFVVAVMYLLMPLDIIPEAMFGFFGLLDDIFIAFLCAIYLSIIYRRFLINRANEAET